MPKPDDNANRVTVLIDRDHSVRLMRGKPVTIKVPKGATELTLHCAPAEHSFSFAEVIDVFFNGRRAHA